MLSAFSPAHGASQMSWRDVSGCSGLRASCLHQPRSPPTGRRLWESRAPKPWPSTLRRVVSVLFVCAIPPNKHTPTHTCVRTCAFAQTACFCIQAHDHFIGHLLDTRLSEGTTSSFMSAQWNPCGLGGGARDTWVSLSLVPSSGNGVSLGRRQGVCRLEGSCALVCEENASVINLAHQG